MCTFRQDTKLLKLPKTSHRSARLWRVHVKECIVNIQVNGSKTHVWINPKMIKNSYLIHSESFKIPILDGSAISVDFKQLTAYYGRTIVSILQMYSWGIAKSQCVVGSTTTSLNPQPSTTMVVKTQGDLSRLCKGIAMSKSYQTWRNTEAIWQQWIPYPLLEQLKRVVALLLHSWWKVMELLTSSFKYSHKGTEVSVYKN